MRGDWNLSNSAICFAMGGYEPADFGFQPVAALAFYGEAAYMQIAKAEQSRRDWERVVREAKPHLIDDVAGQITP